MKTQNSGSSGSRRAWQMFIGGLLACVMAGCGSTQDGDGWLHCQGSVYGVRKVETTVIRVTHDGKIQWVSDGARHERQLEPRERESLQETLRKSDFARMNDSYGRAIPDGGFRRIVADVDGVRHDVTLFPHAEEGVTSGPPREALEHFDQVWDRLVSLAKCGT